MAYAVVESESAGSANASETTSHTITMPATVTAGARLVAAMVMSIDEVTVPSFTWPAGWTELIDTYADTWIGIAMSAAWRIADGTEDSTSVTVTTNVSQKSAHKSWSITGAGSVYASSVVASAGNSVTSDPPSFSPSPGSKEYLWLAISGMDSDRTVTTYPTNYTNTGYKQSDTAGGSSTIAWARYTTTAATENPAAFTWQNVDQNIAFVLAVEPTVAADTITSVSQIYPGGLVSVVMANYASAPLSANSYLNNVLITLEAGATTTACTFYAPAESAFLFGGAHAATRFNTNYTLRIANASDTADYTVQVTPLSSDQLAARSADALANPLADYNGQSVATNDDVYQYTYSGPADSFTPYPSTNDWTPLETAFEVGSKYYDVSASSWSTLNIVAFPAAAAPGGGTLEITSTLIAENPPGTLVPSDVNLASFGDLDWLHTARLTTETYDTKSGGTMIGAPANIGTPAWVRGTGDSFGHPLMSWTGGDPLATGTGYRYYDYTTVNGAGKRFPISPAGALVKIYLLAGGYNAAEIKVEVSFSDESATTVSASETMASQTHRYRLYEITAQPEDDEATIQVDITKVSGSGLIGWQAIAVSSGTSAATYSLTVSDTTITPGQSVTATLVGGPFQGAITAAYAVYGDHEIPVGFTVLTPTTTTITAPGQSAFSAGQNAEFLPMYANWTLRIVAGEESADSANTNQIVPTIAGDYGTVAAPPWGYSPSGAQEGDKAYIHIVAGAGTATPESFDFTESENTLIHVYCFSVASSSWLARRVVPLPSDWINVDKIITGLVKKLVKTAVKVIS